MRYLKTPFTTEPCMCMSGPDGTRKSCGKLFIQQFSDEGRFHPADAAELCGVVNSHDTLVAFLAAVESALASDTMYPYDMVQVIQRHAKEARAALTKEMPQ